MKRMNEVLAFMFSPRALENYSAAYRETRDRLLGSVVSPNRHQELEKMRVPIIVDGSCWNNELLEAFLAQTNAIYRRQREEQLSGSEISQLELDAIRTDMDRVHEGDLAIAVGDHFAQRVVPLVKLRIDGFKEPKTLVCRALSGQSRDLELSMSGSMALESDRAAVFSSIAAQSALKKACPLLKYLELRHVDGDGIDCIVDAFETGACKLSALNLNGVVITDGVESLFRIFKALMNPKTAIAQQLKELHVRTSASGAWLARQLLGVLDRNHALQTVFVSAAKKRLDQANGSLQDLEPVYFAQPHRPFPLRSKLSLLSVADEASSGVNPIVQDALSRLNRTVFQQIFEYAAPPMERVVRAVDDRNPLRRRRNEDL
ncbi:hypothetical protein Poli38472_011196 [Pythium oligandrum]|uniref:Uncharacterized protein n=1 Tax=Pythium oligandrum TaxID=41045 RepID=A0A8K1FLW2_PYTOL|nr:hypothetical protein Poli38472_011196 [Pythium oligandrum]|eukprot:TMW67576.1 hypothetical protein Poli38472_011196 [Pythium oligandrum]